MIGSIVRALRVSSLAVLKTCGAFDGLRDSRWRDQRLLLLCYHGISLEDEHLWRPATYISPQLFDQRLAFIAQAGYQVLPLAEAVERLYARSLPARSVVLTFDDGTYDFYKQAFPRLKKYGFPATVYQTTYYCDYDRPIFHLICSYILWKRRGQVLHADTGLGLPGVLDLRTDASRRAIVVELVTRARDQNWTEQQKNQLSEVLAIAVGLDFPELVRQRVLQLMRPDEIAQLARAGVDFQLHTHRHRTPLDEALFRREICDNRRRLQSMIPGKSTSHFCYPSGVYELEFLPWLQAEQVVSATTCDPGLASSATNPLLLPRFVDTSNCTTLEFEAWLSGTASLITYRGTRPHRPLSDMGREAADCYTRRAN